MKVFAFILLAADIIYTFLQHYYLPLDGDVSAGVLHYGGVEKILADPFGLSVIFGGATYPNPNRFFIYKAYSIYFRNVPLLLQNFMSPIDSIYFSVALSKVLMQLLILWPLAYGAQVLSKGRWWIAALLAVPLFQTLGFNRHIGLIDRSVAYAFFYSLPAGLLLLYFLPFFRSVFQPGYRPGVVTHVSLVFFTVILPFGGPLVPGVLLIVFLLVAVHQLRMGFQKILCRIQLPFIIYFSAAALLCLYSLYIGMANSLDEGDSLPLLQRYPRLFQGVLLLLTWNIGFPLLLAVALINLFLLWRMFPQEGKTFRSIYGYTAMFVLLYILLLPLGGYKSYRPHILRYDTLIPVTIAVMFLYISTSCFLLSRMAVRFRRAYIAAAVVFALFYTFADPILPRGNACEREMLGLLSRSEERIVQLPAYCKVISWEIAVHPEMSKANSELLFFWNITKEPKLYYQK